MKPTLAQDTSFAIIVCRCAITLNLAGAGVVVSGGVNQALYAAERDRAFSNVTVGGSSSMFSIKIYV